MMVLEHQLFPLGASKQKQTTDSVHRVFKPLPLDSCGTRGVVKMHRRAAVLAVATIYIYMYILIGSSVYVRTSKSTRFKYADLCASFKLVLKT